MKPLVALLTHKQSTCVCVCMCVCQYVCTHMCSQTCRSRMAYGHKLFHCDFWCILSDAFLMWTKFNVTLRVTLMFLSIIICALQSFSVNANIFIHRCSSQFLSCLLTGDSLTLYHLDNSVKCNVYTFTLFLN